MLSASTDLQVLPRELLMLDSTVLDAEIEAGLSALINLSGKMRMLSHRVAMFALLAAQEKDVSGLHELDSALFDFSSILDAIRHGSPERYISEQVARLLEHHEAVSATAMTAIERFIKQAKLLRKALEAGTCPANQLGSFTRFVAGELLRALNEVTDNISKTLQSQLDARSLHEDQTRKAVKSAIESIDSVSKRVKLISLNASIEASHAGEMGRGFSIIAAEIRTLSEEAARATQGIMKQMS
jgi:hypothetical protein